MQLTRLWLDPRASRARRDLGDPYELHRTLVRAFVADESQTPPRILWRLEASTAWNDPQVIVQSNQPGDWTCLTDLHGYLKRPVETKAVAVDSLLLVGARYRFRLLANPTVSRGGKRYGLTSQDAQLAWLSRQAEKSGFDVDTALVVSSDVLVGRKAAMRIQLQRAMFEGVLRVTELGAMRGALLAGLGPGKAFGCGLLSVARI